MGFASAITIEGGTTALEARLANHRDQGELFIVDHWTPSVLTNADTRQHCETVLLHSGVFKQSWPAYPHERLSS